MGLSASNYIKLNKGCLIYFSAIDKQIWKMHVPHPIPTPPPHIKINGHADVVSVLTNCDNLQIFLVTKNNLDNLSEVLAMLEIEIKTLVIVNLSFVLVIMKSARNTFLWGI